jgi:hypothetical protein
MRREFMNTVVHAENAGEALKNKISTLGFRQQ